MTSQSDSGKKWLNTPLAILIGSVIISISIIFSNFHNRADREMESALSPIDEKNIVMAPLTETDHVYGNHKAKVLLFEYADTECPFCKSTHAEFRKIVDGSNGKVGWVYRYFPLDSLHPAARKQAEAAECAASLGGNEKFWQFLEALFQATPKKVQPTSGKERDEMAELSRLAVRIGINAKKFTSCLSSGEYKKKVESDYQDGVRIGITGTPTTILMNAKGEKKVLLGAAPESAIKAAIEKLD